MDYNEDLDITQAATQPDVTGALQKLMLQRLQAMQPQDPQARTRSLQEYQEALRQNPMGEMTPTQMGLYSYLGNVGKMPSNVAAIQGAAAGGKALADMQAGLVKGNQLAAGVGYKDTVDRDKLDVQELSAIRNFAKSNSISPEKLSAVYNGARNEAAQVAKDYNFSSAEERSAWIEQQANAAVENYISRFSQAGGGYGVQRPNAPVGGAPGAPSNASSQPPGSAPNPSPIQPAGRPAPGAPVAPPTARDRAEEARQKEFTTKSESSAEKDYTDNVLGPAQIADKMLDTVNMLRQIPHTQDMFAPWREKLGRSMDAIGLDGKMAREAQSLQQVRPLLNKIANDRLMMAKGTQTEGDAQRAYNEFLKIDDTQQAADFMMAWTEELARRAKFRNEVYRYSADANKTWTKGQDTWASTDYAQTAPVAMLNGKPYTFTNWRDSFLRANKDAGVVDAVKVWNQLTRGNK